MKKTKKAIVFMMAVLSITVSFFFATPTTSYALTDWEAENLSGYGTWFETYSDIFETANPVAYELGMYDKYKEYDYVKGEFDCDGGWIKSTSCQIDNILIPVYFDFVVFPVEVIKDTVAQTGDIQNNSVLVTYRDATAGLGVTLLAIFLSFHMVKIVALRLGDPDDVGGLVNEKTTKIIIGSILLGIYTKFMEWFFELSNTAAESVLGESMMTPAEHLARMLSMGKGVSFIIIILLTIIMIVFWIAFMYRIAVAGFLFAIGPIAITTIANDTYNYFDLWLKQMINNAVTIVLQAMAFAIGTVLVTGSATSDLFNLMLGFVFYILAIMIPAMLGGLGSSSGTTRSLATIARTLAMRR
jgi:hypothetical protein